MVAGERAIEPLINRRLWARSQEDAHDRARVVTTQMEAEQWVLIARSWVSSARGGTVTLVFARQEVRSHADMARTLQAFYLSGQYLA